MMNNGKAPNRTGGMHSLTYHPGYSYCFFPSLEPDKGEAHAYNYVPDFVKHFSHYIEVDEVRKSIIHIISNEIWITGNH